MKKIEKNEMVIEFDDKLSPSETIAIVKVAIDEFIDGKDYLGGYRFSPISAEIEFYRALCQLKVKDFNMTLFEGIYENGIHKELLNTVENAQDAYTIFQETIKRISSASNIIDINIQALIKMIEQKIPDNKSLNKIITNLGKQFKILQENKKEEE